MAPTIVEKFIDSSALTDLVINQGNGVKGLSEMGLNYPKCPNPEQTVGVGRYSDVSTLTILLQDEIGGLYVRGNHGEGDNWIHVPPIKGSLVINIGDALQILGNGRYKSVEHRVIANGSNNRISVPIFVNPRPTDTIAPLPEVLQGGEKPIYKQVLYSDYVQHFFARRMMGRRPLNLLRYENNQYARGSKIPKTQSEFGQKFKMKKKTNSK